MNQDIKSVIPGQLFVVSAPSGAGKTSLVRALIESEADTGVSVSHTTRAQRNGEENGVNYHFADDATFKAMIEADEFLEWATVFGHLYGTSLTAAHRVLDTGKHLILEIDWQGAQQIRQKVSGTQTIFILPPSLSALRNRLRNRAQDDEATVETRMAAAFTELAHFAEFDYLIVNDEFDAALKELTEIVGGRGDKYEREKRLPELNSLITDLLPQNTP